MEGADKMDQKPAHDPLPPSPEKAAASTTPGAALPPLAHRQTLVRREPAKLQARFAECAGSTTADCAAVFCCCPCGLAHLFFVAAVKLPAGLLRRALGRKRKMKRCRYLVAKRAGVFAVDDEDVYDDLSIYRSSLLSTVSSEEVLWKAKTSLTADDFAELEKEMSNRFYGAGFWRSPSQVHRD